MVNKGGRYQFSLSFLGDNTTGVKVEMYVLSCEHEVHHAIFPEEVWHEHGVEIELPQSDSVDTDIELEVGLRMDSPVSYGAVKDMKLICLS